ncbi:3-hydroxybutyryl-CoA dehydrogenase [Thermus scotoductus]|jgi:3-hydroxybutyryl-CoA dehydrogenase|uniref:3-hydroxybutyryl-CoA dehydrogenase n=2 Tax=Thermus scotoductus TaxID=37636 RepID=A0A0N0IQM4_THESC|nr:MULTISPECIES: 3-hydroxybutyryl-CoA dehydrogenase [Thermus]ADW21429.1 3-hydroxybutyryl-CoA dehydrogenase [Thermus scotoductus SA-01]ETN88524.1 3-hydroxybutyryl-CoA dehydrogenase [Thermus sp. NMX2.A1]KPD30702.1 3-hydroxybutyryl-CoA dehydrogenase [Thermus scotoductus]RTG92210.1 3-hydroxybutyryl-CoA dehydrogenase [Thermus scotoductus]RTG93337.1 3-hydroxybutyryl-CoA dehydrogenase [Thermus scotoductus]
MEVRKIGVVGAGQMGSGIAQVAAQAGFEVVLVDVAESFLERGLKAIQRSLGRFVEKGRIAPQDLEATLGRIRTTVVLGDLAEADLIVEAIVEDEGEKRRLFERLGSLVKPEAILASNTSSIPITALARYSGRPERFIGMHFFNPVPLMQLVEVIRGELTSEETRDVVVEVARRMGKTPLEVQDYPGFVSNRLLMPMINEAIEALREGVATKEAIDGVMRLGMNHPMGPLELADLIGLDTCLAIMEVLHRGFGDDKYRPSPLLRRMVQAGLLGRKTGRGFYTYDEKGNKVG